jgi:hypothetical protein
MRTRRRGAVAKGNWYMLAGLVVVLLLLAYGWLGRGGSDVAPATTAPGTGMETGTGTGTAK